MATILSAAYDQMEAINTAIDRRFAEDHFVNTVLGALDFEAIGMAVVTLAKEMEGWDVSRLSRAIRMEYEKGD